MARCCYYGETIVRPAIVFVTSLQLPFVMVRAGLHWLPRISKLIVPPLSMLGWYTGVVNSTWIAQRVTYSTIIMPRKILITWVSMDTWAPDLHIGILHVITDVC